MSLTQPPPFDVEPTNDANLSMPDEKTPDATPLPKPPPSSVTSTSVTPVVSSDSEPDEPTATIEDAHRESLDDNKSASPPHSVVTEPPSDTEMADVPVEPSPAAPATHSAVRTSTKKKRKRKTKRRRPHTQQAATSDEDIKDSHAQTEAKPTCPSPNTEPSAAPKSPTLENSKTSDGYAALPSLSPPRDWVTKYRRFRAKDRYANTGHLTDDAGARAAFLDAFQPESAYPPTPLPSTNPHPRWSEAHDNYGCIFAFRLWPEGTRLEGYRLFGSLRGMLMALRKREQ